MSPDNSAAVWVERWYGWVDGWALQFGRASDQPAAARSSAAWWLVQCSRCGHIDGDSDYDGAVRIGIDHAKSCAAEFLGERQDSA